MFKSSLLLFLLGTVFLLSVTNIEAAPQNQPQLPPPKVSDNPLSQDPELLAEQREIEGMMAENVSDDPTWDQEEREIMREAAGDDQWKLAGKN